MVVCEGCHNVLGCNWYYIALHASTSTVLLFRYVPHEVLSSLTLCTCSSSLAITVTPAVA